MKYEDVDSKLPREDVILNRNEDATEKLTKSVAIKSGEVTPGSGSPEERIHDAMLKGMDTLRSLCQTGNRRSIRKSSRSSSQEALGREAKTDEAATDDWRSGSVTERISHALVRVFTGHIEADTEEAKGFDRLLEAIEGPLMDGMKVVGELFAKRQMFASGGKSGDAKGGGVSAAIYGKNKDEVPPERS